MEEIWKDIDGFEGRYQISSLGKVKRSKRVVLSANRFGEFRKTIKEKELLGFYSKGYHRVLLDNKKYSVHRLVAEAFIPNPDNLPIVNHKDENPSNNSVDNLEWCTVSYNLQYGSAIERLQEKRKKTMSEKGWENYKIRKPILQYTLDGELIKEWDGVTSIEKEYGVNHSYICRVLNKGVVWKNSIWKRIKVEN